MARRRQIEGDMQACENELGTLTVQPAWRCVHRTNVTSRGTLIVVSIPIVEHFSDDDLYLRVSVFAPEIIYNKDDAKRKVSRNFEGIKRVLGEMLPSGRATNRDVDEIRELFFGDGTHTSWNGINIEHVVPVSVGPAPSENQCLVIDYHIDGNPE